ncbi:MAG TPA: response regulator, partial [Dehalococcoidia bacterium]|nr:response regulator [Dehalococcoidia bacterium]
MIKNPRVIIIDPELDRRAEVQKLLALGRFAVLGESGYGIEAVSLTRETTPDLIVLAVEGQTARAQKTLESLNNAFPELPVVVYSSSTDPATIRQTMVAGARDYLLWPLKEEELGQSLRAVLEQEERRRLRMTGEVEAPPSQGTTITVFGAKGGIGKTTIATNLAVSLSRQVQQSVCLVDLDTRFGDVALMLNLQPERTFADLFLNHQIEELNRELVREYLTPHPSGIQVLAAPTRPTAWRQVNVEYVEKTVQLLT